MLSRGEGEDGYWRKIEEGPSRNMNKGHMDKAKGGGFEGREGGLVGGKWRQPCLDNNKK